MNPKNLKTIFEFAKMLKNISGVFYIGLSKKRVLLNSQSLKTIFVFAKIKLTATGLRGGGKLVCYVFPILNVKRMFI